MENASELSDCCIVYQTIDAIALEEICNVLVHLRFLIEEAQSRVVPSEIGFALHGDADVDEFDRQALVAKMKSEIVPDAVSVHADCS